MNQRIEKLANVWANIRGEDEKLGITYTFSEKALEKFSELIVRECCDIFVELRTRPADLAVKDVKKHFGVEE